jgi:hypothetical protein
MRTEAAFASRLKPAKAGRWRRWSSGKNFKSDEAFEIEAFGLVNHSHSAAAEHLDDALGRDGLADHGATVIAFVGL